MLDGAHGGHFRFYSASVYAGEYADIWVDGVHKTLPCLTQTAVLNVNDGACISVAAEAVKIFRTSSPSYPLMASIEYGEEFMAVSYTHLDVYKRQVFSAQMHKVIGDFVSLAGVLLFAAVSYTHLYGENALFFLIKQGDKAFMQCNDTGYLYEENFAFLEKLGVKIDFISLDCTNGKLSFGKEGTHMGAKECEELVARLRKCDFVKKDARFAVTHFSHNGAMTHGELERRFAPIGVSVAYDGWEVRL